jgi:hypothetical protein
MATGHDITVDFMGLTNDGRLWARMKDVRPGFVLIAGQHAIVGCEDVHPAVAQIVSVGIERGIELQVLEGGGVDEHRHLLATA